MAEGKRRRRYLEARAEYGNHIYEDVVDEQGGIPDRFLLVESSKYDGTYFLTSFDSAEDAASYHDCQEYPDDWPVSELIDLDTGQRYSAWTETTYRTTFTKVS